MEFHYIVIINEFDEKEYTDLFYYIEEYLNEANNSKNIPLLILLHINDNYYNIIYYNEDLKKDNIIISKEN